MSQLDPELKFSIQVKLSPRQLWQLLLGKVLLLNVVVRCKGHLKTYQYGSTYALINKKESIYNTKNPPPEKLLQPVK